MEYFLIYLEILKVRNSTVFYRATFEIARSLKSIATQAPYLSMLFFSLFCFPLPPSHDPYLHFPTLSRCSLFSLLSLSRTLPYHVEATSFSLCSTDPLLYPLLFLSPFAFIQRGLYFGGLRPVQPRCCQFNEDPTLDNGSIFLLISFRKQHLFSLDLYIAIPFFRFKVSIRQGGMRFTRFHLDNLYSKREKYLLKIFAKMF